MTGRQKKITKRLAWLLTLLLVISALLPQPSDRTGCDGGNSSQQNKPGDENRGNQDADGVFPAGEYHRTAGSHLEFG